jgi:hypothetical protein
METAFLAPEAVVWDSRRHQVHHLNPSASAVWLCIDGDQTADQITTELSEIFETPQEVIRPDVDDALAEFARLGLIDTDDESAVDTDHESVDDVPPAAPDDHGVVVLARPPDP